MAFTYTTIDGQRVQTDVASAFGRLNNAFKAAFGISLRVRSGTRTTEEQKRIFFARYRAQASGVGPYKDVRWYAGVRYVRVSAEGTVAVPGSSNHEENGPVGPRALDIYDTGSTAGVTTAGTTRANWIRNNARTYGFNPAGYNFGEPWHIEYTGQFGGGSPAGSSTGFPARERYGEDWVKSVQTKLNRLGYKLEVDGWDGALTQIAVINFQGKNGLVTDGVAGPETNAKLDAVLAGSGSGNIAVDGQWGEATVRKLQAALGVDVDGDAGAKTWSELQKRLGVPVDGEFGPDSTKALQKFLKVEIDGAMGPQTITALQSYLNSGGKFLNATPPVTEKIDEDGEFGPATVKALQINLGFTGADVDGVFGPATIKALQKALGQAEDGQVGVKTIKALQTNLGFTGTDVDGAMGPATVKALQIFLNAKKIFSAVRIEDAPIVAYPKPASPTYPGAEYWNHSPNSSPRRDTDKVEYFVIHHAADPRPKQDQIDRFMRPNDRNVSPNWFIGADGSINEIVPPDKFRAWTTGQFDYKAVTVETQNTSGDPNWGISEESHVAISKLVAWAHIRWGIPLDRQHVIGHREVPGVAATQCPLHIDVDKVLSYAINIINVIPEIPPVITDPPVVVPPVTPPTAETWTITLPKAEAEELKKLLTEFTNLLP